MNKTALAYHFSEQTERCLFGNEAPLRTANFKKNGIEYVKLDDGNFMLKDRELDNRTIREIGACDANISTLDNGWIMVKE